MPRQPSLQWYGEMSEKTDKTEFTNMLRSSLALKRLRTILDEKVSEASATLVSEDFDTPSWAFKQAYLNGKIKTLLELRDDLLGFLQE